MQTVCEEGGARQVSNLQSGDLLCLYGSLLQEGSRLLSPPLRLTPQQKQKHNEPDLALPALPGPGVHSALHLLNQRDHLLLQSAEAAAEIGVLRDHFQEQADAD